MIYESSIVSLRTVEIVKNAGYTFFQSSTELF